MPRRKKRNTCTPLKTSLEHDLIEFKSFRVLFKDFSVFVFFVGGIYTYINIYYLFFRRIFLFQFLLGVWCMYWFWSCWPQGSYQFVHCSLFTLKIWGKSRGLAIKEDICPTQTHALGSNCQLGTNGASKEYTHSIRNCAVLKYSLK